MDSGITSRNATASMYPAPSAKKYCKYFRGQSRRTTKYPPIKFPAAATNPNPAANAVRNAKSCAINRKSGSRAAALHNQRHRISISLCPLCSQRSLCKFFFFFFFFTSLCRHFFSSSAMPEQNYIPLLHNIFLPLKPDLRLLARRRNAPRRQKIAPLHNFRPNKSALDIAVNRSRRLLRRRPLANRPGSHFRLARGKKLDQSLQVIRRANQPVQPRLFQSVRRQKLSRFLLIHLREFRLEPPANRDHRRVWLPLQCAQLMP